MGFSTPLKKERRVRVEENRLSGVPGTMSPRHILLLVTSPVWELGQIQGGEIRWPQPPF
jgi:hypothetical protein